MGIRRLKYLLLLAAISCIPLFSQESAQHEAGDPMAVWKWANFLILAGILGYFIAKNMPSAFAARTTEIQKGIAEAQKLKTDAEKRAADMDARMAALGTEVERLRTQSQAEMKQEGERIRQETVSAIQKVQDQSASEIEAAGKVARRELKQYAASLALDLAEQRIRARMDSKAEGALIDNFITDLSRQGGKN